MSIDLAVRDAVAQWEPPAAEPDWRDVLRRARPPARRRVRRVGFALVAAAAALVLALPGLGIGDRLGRLVGIGKRPGLALGATLIRADGTRAGTFTVRTGRLFVTPELPSRPFKPVGAPLRWTLSLAVPATTARLVVRDSGKTLALLCRPCAEGSTKGTNHLRRGAFSALFGRADVLVTDDQGEARGRVRLQRPPRR